MNGGSSIKDLYKTEVYRLSRCATPGSRRARADPRASIPENVIVRRDRGAARNQKDQDTLPPYDALDQILERLVEREEPIAADRRGGLRARGGLKSTHAQPRRIQRRQAAPGVKVNAENFRPRPPYPIVNRFRDPA